MMCHSEPAKNLVVYSEILHYVQDDTQRRFTEHES